MRKYVAVLALAIAVETPTPARAQASALSPLPPAAVDSAISDGLRTKNTSMLVIGEDGGGFTAALLSSGFPLYSIYAQSALARIRQLAAEHAKKYLMFTSDSVRDSLRRPLLTIHVVPGKPRIVAGSMRRADPLKHIVLQGRGKQPSGEAWSVVQPISITTSPVEWTNGFGARFEGESMTALFAERDVPFVDFDVVIITSGDEHRWKIAPKDLDGLHWRSSETACTPSSVTKEGDDLAVSVSLPYQGRCATQKCRYAGGVSKISAADATVACLAEAKSGMGSP